MSDWREYKIGELGKVVTGKTPPSTSPELLFGEIPFITPGDMSEDARDVSTERFVSTGWDPKGRLLLPEGSVCVVCIGMTIGKVCMTSRPSHTNQQINSIIVDVERFDPSFVFYSMRDLSGEIRVRATGAQTRIINKTVFSDIAISVPPLETQRRIASILGAYDDLIETNRQRIAVLEEMARGLFEEWFVRFRFPGNEEVATLDTPDGPLPKGWVWGVFQDLAREVRQTISPENSPADTPYVGLEHMPRRSITLDQHGRAEEVSSLKSRFQRSDILFGKIRPYFHKVVWAPFDGVSSTDAIVLRPVAGLAAQALAVASSDAFVAYSVQTSNGTKMPCANASVLADYRCALAPSDISSQFQDTVGPIVELCATLQTESQRLAASRDLLFPRLISGQLSVGQAERELKEAA